LSPHEGGQCTLATIIEAFKKTIEVSSLKAGVAEYGLF